MATDTEIQHAFKIILGAGLDYPPRADEIPNRINSWCELLTDIPGECLVQAARDIAISGEKFPSVSRVRKQAAEALHHNGRAKETPFDVGYVRGARLPRPPMYREEHDRLKAKYANGSGLPTDDELYALEMLRGTA